MKKESLRPDVLELLEQTILQPILEKVFSYVYPYLLGLTILWVVMFLCTIIILVLLWRSPTHISGV
jgi:hypothetical protein